MNGCYSLILVPVVFALLPVSLVHSAETKKLKRKSENAAVSKGNQATVPRQIGLAPQRGYLPGGVERNMGQSGRGVAPINVGSQITGQQSGGAKKPAMPKGRNQGGSADSDSISISDLSKEAQLKKLADPTAGVKLPGGNGLTSPRSGGKGDLAGKITHYGKDGDDSSQGSGTPDIGRVTVDRGAGKNKVSKTEQQSGSGKEDPADRIYDSNNEYMGTRGELAQKREDDLWGDLIPKEQRQNHAEQNLKEDQAGFKNKEEAEKFLKQVEKEEAEMRRFEEAKAKEKEDRFKEGVHNANDAVPANPGDDTVTKPMDTAIAPTDRMTKSPRQLERERKRKVSLPDENKREQPTQNVRHTAEDARAKHTDGLINPMDGGEGNVTGTEGNLGTEGPTVNNPTGRASPPGSKGPDGPGDPKE